MALGRTVGSTSEQDKIISPLNSKFTVALCEIYTIKITTITSYILVTDITDRQTATMDYLILHCAIIGEGVTSLIFHSTQELSWQPFSVA